MSSRMASKNWFSYRFMYTGFITQDSSLLVRRTQGKAGRRNLERIDSNIR